MTKLKRRYTYLDHDFDKEVSDAAKESKLSVSTWIKQACFEKIKYGRIIDDYRRKEGK
jgi:hypothetical protein